MESTQLVNERSDAPTGSDLDCARRGIAAVTDARRLARTVEPRHLDNLTVRLHVGSTSRTARIKSDGIDLDVLLDDAAEPACSLFTSAKEMRAKAAHYIRMAEQMEAAARLL